MKTFLTCAAGALLIATASASTAEQFKVQRYIEFSAPSADVWNLVGDFCDIDDWHPAVQGCVLKVIDGKLHRILTLADGGEIVEKRIAVEPGISYTYAIVSSPLPVEKYVATLSVQPGNPNQIAWSGRFKSDDPNAEQIIAGIYEAGLAAIEAKIPQ